ncbi:MAG TPA: radical SAM family heme chaperone HemW [Anaerolineaceae bacterium]|jgi:oxygen-independent coproporphyrinogen III oxidase
MLPYSLYLHIPFCRHRCAYCDFNTYAGQSKSIPAYVEALNQELVGMAQASGERLAVHTLFFGGGTPSLLPPASYERLFQTIQAHYNLLDSSEITIEANPGTVSLSYLKDIHALGVNRISFGVQSANPFELRQLERQHDPQDVIHAVDWARAAGFRHLNLDLIYALPEQIMQSWEHTLDFALALDPEHLSLYSLTIEEGTPLYGWVSKGMVSEPDPDVAADMYDAATARLAAAGYTQYEISNWAKMGTDQVVLACRHNLQYWRNLPYLGFGAGAHGSAGGYRMANVNGIAGYIRRCQAGHWQHFPFSPANASATPIDTETEIKETMMVGLRLVQEGVSEDGFKGRFGLSLMDRYSREIGDLIRSGLLEWTPATRRSLRLTTRGRLLGNQVFMRFI